MLLRVLASPNAKRSEILDWEDDPVVGRVLRVRVGAPATDGKANTELAKHLAKALKLPKSQVRLIKGDSSRHKTFELPDGTILPGE